MRGSNTVTQQISYEVSRNLVLKILANSQIYKNFQKGKSVRKDVLTEALERVILPKLKANGHSISKTMEFTKLCWNELDDALVEIGCRNVKVDPLGSVGNQDLNEFQATHGSLLTPAKTFKAFRERLARFSKNST